jgi:hypothetical protein
MDPLGSVYLGKEGSGDAQIFQTGGFTQATQRYSDLVQKDIAEFKTYQALGEQELKQNLDIALDGFSHDISGELFTKMEDFQQEAIRQYSEGVNMGRVTDFKSYSELQRKKKGLQKDIALATAQKNTYAEIMGIMADPKLSSKILIDEATIDQLGEWRSLPIEERAKVDPRSFLVEKIDVNSFSKELADGVKQFQSDARRVGTLGKDVANIQTTQTQDRQALAEAANLAWDSNATLRRNMKDDKEAWMELMMSKQQVKQESRAVREGSDKTTTGKDSVKSKPGSVRTVKGMYDNVTTLGGAIIKGGLGDNPQGVPLINTKQITVYDPATQQRVRITPNEVIRGDNGVVYLIGNSPDYTAVETRTTGDKRTTTDKEEGKQKQGSLAGGKSSMGYEDESSESKSQSIQTSGKGVTTSKTDANKRTTKKNTVAIQVPINTEDEVLSLIGLDDVVSFNQLFNIKEGVSSESTEEGSDFWDF